MDVRVEAPPGTAVRMRDVVPEAGTLATDVTYGRHKAENSTKPGSTPTVAFQERICWARLSKRGSTAHLAHMVTET